MKNSVEQSNGKLYKVKTIHLKMGLTLTVMSTIRFDWKHGDWCTMNTHFILANIIVSFLFTWLIWHSLIENQFKLWFWMELTIFIRNRHFFWQLQSQWKRLAKMWVKYQIQVLVFFLSISPVGDMETECMSIATFFVNPENPLPRKIISFSSDITMLKMHHILR